MEIEIQSQRNNPLLDRNEVRFIIRHIGEGTPNRELVKSELAEKLNVKKEDIVVNYMKSSFGTQLTKGYAKIYTSLDKAKTGERKFILVRNKLITAEKKATKKAEGDKPLKAEVAKLAEQSTKEGVKPPEKQEKKEEASHKPEAPKKPAEEKKG